MIVKKEWLRNDEWVSLVMNIIVEVMENEIKLLWD